MNKSVKIVTMFAVFVLLVTMMAGCSGGGADLPADAPWDPSPSAPTIAGPLAEMPAESIAQLTQNAQPVAADFVPVLRDVPELMDTESVKGGGETTTFHFPEFSRGGKFIPMTAYKGKKFLGGSGYYRFTGIDRIVVGSAAKGGVTYRYKVTNALTGEILPPALPGIWQLWSGTYSVRAYAAGVPAYTFCLQIGQAVGNKVMRAVALNPTNGSEYRSDASCKYLLGVGDQAFLVPEWRNWVTGQKVSVPQMPLQASVYIYTGSDCLMSAGNQSFGAIKYGNVAGGLSVYTTGGGMGAQDKGGVSGGYWYCNFQFMIGKS